MRMVSLVIRDDIKGESGGAVVELSGEEIIYLSNILYRETKQKPAIELAVNQERERLFEGADDEDIPPPLDLEIVECHFGGEGGKVNDKDPINYANSTGLMWGSIREALKTGSLHLYYDDKQISQLSNRKYSVNSAGEIVLERKEEMKKRGLSSPDMADALGLALYDPPVSDWSLD